MKVGRSWWKNFWRKQKMTKRACLLAGLFLVAAVFTVVGIVSGEPAVVLTKAVTICLECVGIG